MHVQGPTTPAGFQQAPRPAQNGGIMPSNGPPMETIPLNTLIDYIIHKTYHDIVVMAEIFPGKSDMERKIDMAHFANRTRQMFIRLLAVVKWASSVGKVIKCEEITQYLEQQAMLFVDTADKLHTLANQLVVQARLPTFAVPAAVDVLTTGTYPRLPRAIRDRIIPPDPITPQEKSATLKRLDQILMYRLVTTNIPLQIMELVVDKGMVKLIVPREFQAHLTLMGDDDNVPWRLLKLEFMVQDRETGSGRALVHDRQINYIHELVQSRLIANEDPLQDLYNVLHSFCLSLQLEVLQAQAMRLIQVRWGRLIQIDECQTGNRVVLSYWRHSPYKSVQQQPMSVIVQQKQTDDAWYLDVSHKPPLLLQNISLVEKASKIQDLSIERLLSDTVQVRSFHKLYELKQMIQKHVKNDDTYISVDHSCLVITLLEPCQSNENLFISIDPQTGICIPVLKELDKSTLMEFEKIINEAPLNILVWIPKLRFHLAKERCKMTVQNLPATCSEELSLSNRATHPINLLSNEVIYIRLTNFVDYYIVVELFGNAINPTKILYRYHLLKVIPNEKSVFLTRRNDSLEIKAHSLVELETLMLQDHGDASGSSLEDSNDGSQSVTHPGSHFNTELAHVIAICDSRIPFITLMEELDKEGFVHQGILEEGVNIGLCVKILTFPDIPSSVLSPVLCQSLNSSVVEFTFRLVDKFSKLSRINGSVVWSAELVFCESPLKTESHLSNVTHLMLQLDYLGSGSSVKLFMDEWTSILKLYEPVVHFAEALTEENSRLPQLVSVYSYNYKSIVLKYGNNKHFLVTIKWSTQSNKFILLFGRWNSKGLNNHMIASHALMNMFNSDPDIGKLIQVLHDTSDPIQAICSLPTLPLMGMNANLPIAPNPQQNFKNLAQCFTLIVQTPTHFRLSFRSTYALDIYCLSDKRVKIRDGSFSHFDSSKIKEDAVPITGLKTFFMFCTRQNIRKRSASERDNPYSPGQQTSSSVGEMQSIQRGVWAGANPVTISHELFSKLLAPPNTQQGYSSSLLEMFLGNALIGRELSRLVRNSTSDSPYYHVRTNINHEDPHSFTFAAGSLMFHTHMQYVSNKPQLHLEVVGAPLTITQEKGIAPETWPSEDIRIIEQFFRNRVACEPFLTSNLHAFCYIITGPSLVLRDLIKVIRLELTKFQSEPAIKWIPMLCLTVPPSLKYAQSGCPAIYIKDKILIFVQLTPKIMPGPPMHRQSVIIPIVWNLRMNNIGTLPANSTHLQRIDLHLKQMMERWQPNTECSLFATVRYLMEHLTMG